MPLANGDIVAGRYRLLERVGQGSFGTVWKAQDQSTRAVVAIKQVPLENTSPLVEVRTTLGWDHPNIIQVYQATHLGTDGAAIVYQWGGESLEQILRRQGRLSLQETVALARAMLSALSYAHSRNVLHRDLKPSNVLFDGDKYRLSDFGIRGELIGGHTVPGELAGTILYMAPEAIRTGSLTAASDIFSLGLLLVEALHGKRPSDGNVVDTMRRRISEPTDVPESPLKPFLDRCLAIEPGDRYASAEEALSSLAALVASGGDGGRVMPMTRLESLHPAAAPPPPAPPASMAPAPVGSITVQAGTVQAASPAAAVTVQASSRKGRRWWIGALALVLLAVAGFSLLTLRRSGSPSAPIKEPLVPKSIEKPPVASSDRRLPGLITGLAIAAAGIAFALYLRRRWTRNAPDVSHRASQLLFGLGDRNELTRSLMIQVDAVVANLRSLDARVVGMSVVAMIREYDESKSSSERQTALMNVVSLMEKLQQHLSPWHIRHKEALALGIALLGCAAGVAQAVAGFLPKP